MIPDATAGAGDAPGGQADWSGLGGAPDWSGPGGLNATRAVAAVRAGTATPESIVADARRRVAAWEPWLGAVVEETHDAAPPPAAGPLAGVVAGVKDLLAVRGRRRWCGAPGILAPESAERDAEVVARLRAAGAAIVATLQTHQFGYGIVTPQTRNPRAPEHIAGGSSGGSAAAVAAGLVHVAIGSDTGGSVRIPAACCGVVGVKPTFGLLPVDGVQPLAPSLDTLGVLAATVADAALTLRGLLGEAADPAASAQEVPIPAQALPISRQALSPEAPRPPRVGMIDVLPGAVDPDVRAVCDEAVRRMQAAGASVVAVRLPSLPDAPRANGVLLALEALAVHEALLEAHPDGWWPSVRERLERARGLRPDDRAWAEAVRARLRGEVEAAFAHADVLVLPTLPVPPPRVGAERVRVGGVDEPVTAALTRLTNPWNLLGVPAGSLPAGSLPAGPLPAGALPGGNSRVPIGLQLVAPWHGERALLDAMAFAEAALGGPWSPLPAPSTPL